MLCSFTFVPFVLFCFCVFLRKISPEPTSAANPPLFAEEDLVLSSHPCPSSSTLYVGHLRQHGLPSSALSAPGIWTGKTRATEAECAHLTAAPPGWPWVTFFKARYIFTCAWTNALSYGSLFRIPSYYKVVSCLNWPVLKLGSSFLFFSEGCVCVCVCVCVFVWVYLCI